MDPELNGKTELHAFVDGELDRAATVKFAARVAASPELAREVARLRADKAMLARVYGGLADQPIPDRLKAPFRKRRQRQSLVRYGAGAGVAMAMALLLWVMPPILKEDRFVSEALSARDGHVSAGRFLAASVLERPDARDQAVATALSVPVKVPDLDTAGYKLASISIYKQAAQLSYRDSAGKLFTLFLRHESGPDRFDIRHRGKMEICVWQNSELAVAMVGEMSNKEMLRLASATYADLNL